MKKISTLGAATVCLLLLAACSDGDNGPAPGSTQATGSPTTTALACSAAGMQAEEPGDDLPPEVAAVRLEVQQAAAACDFELLEDLAFRPDGSFQYSTEEESAGPDAEPAEFWRAQEEAGERPLAAMVELLNAEPGIQEVTEPEGPGSGSEDSYYNWPAEGASDQGYRTSITSQGDWIFFIKE